MLEIESALEQMQAGIARIAATISRAYDEHPEYTVVTLLENTAGQGSNLGHRFEHLARSADAPVPAGDAVALARQMRRAVAERPPFLVQIMEETPGLEKLDLEPLIQLFEGTIGVDIFHSKIRFMGKGIEIGLSGDMLGRVFSGMGAPIDDGPKIIPEERRDINGNPYNPTARNYPSEFIQTGFSAIDGLNLPREYAPTRASS